MPYTLSINDKAIPNQFFFFNDKDKFEKYLIDYLWKYRDRAEELGYISIIILDFQKKQVRTQSSKEKMEL